MELTMRCQFKVSFVWANTTVRSDAGIGFPHTPTPSAQARQSAANRIRALVDALTTCCSPRRADLASVSTPRLSLPAIAPS
eukprot:364266-Chlamydomonas_euryale.AAC.7